MKSLEAARSSLGKLQAKIEKDEKQRDLFDHAGTELKQIEQLLAVLTSREEDIARYKEFRRLRTETVIQDSQFTGLDLPVKKAATRDAAHAALNVFATAWGG